MTKGGEVWGNPGGDRTSLILEVSWMVTTEESCFHMKVLFSASALVEGSSFRDECRPGYGLLARIGRGFLSSCKTGTRWTRGLCCQVWWRRRCETSQDGKFDMMVEHDKDLIWTPARSGGWQDAPIYCGVCVAL
jgi:hypothetical protein